MDPLIVAVFDTGVILQAILSEGGPADECIRLAVNGSILLVTSDATLHEIEDVVSRPKLISKYPQLHTERPNQLTEKLKSSARIMDQPLTIFKLERDRSDEIFLNLAIGCNADFLVSRDRDLLDLRFDSEFTSKFALKILSPVEFLQAVRSR